jgi:hypothetical protein
MVRTISLGNRFHKMAQDAGLTIGFIEAPESGDCRENAEAASRALSVGSSPAPGVTVTRREVRAVAASA